MMTNPKAIVASAVLLAAGLPCESALARELIGEFRGERPTQTPEFKVEAPWILDWRVTGEYSEELAVDVSLVQAELNVHEGNVLKARAPGNGVRLFNDGGRFFFRVDSTLAGWSLRVYELTPEEAKLYTPKVSPVLDY